MAASGFVFPNVQLFDDNGDPLSGGLVNCYIAGTSTRKDTYTSSTLGTPNANPVVLDSAGRAVIYTAATGAYKIVVTTSAAATVWTQDNVSAVTAV